MYNYKHGIEVSHRESIMLPLSLDEEALELFASLFEEDDDDLELFDLLLGKDQDIIPDNWFETFNIRISEILRKLPVGELKHQFTLFKAVAEYSYNSKITEGLTHLMHYYEDSYVEMIFSFSSHYDADTFLLELWDHLENI